ncbi:VanZ family protein [Moheibacter lacus]|uniref:VanZ family protein n=1 Tax=Moheibacter lacus TaxID=2745851 RepID=A0A838ZNK1_9FLAO|nr:VanZ family protein [Moheibacter lacus]MBA5629286.1 VanZ family protein [Moheibacter lacus]
MQQLIRKLQDNFGKPPSRFLFGIYTLILLAMTLLPMSVIPSDGESWLSQLKIENGDKAVHFALFFIFTFLGFAAKFFSKNLQILWVPILFGLIIEILQHFIGWGRSFDLWDLLANSLGILTAYFMIQRIFQPNYLN